MLAPGVVAVPERGQGGEHGLRGDRRRIGAEQAREGRADRAAADLARDELARKFLARELEGGDQLAELDPRQRRERRCERGGEARPLGDQLGDARLAEVVLEHLRQHAQVRRAHLTADDPIALTEVAQVAGPLAGDPRGRLEQRLGLLDRILGRPDRLVILGGALERAAECDRERRGRCPALLRGGCERLREHVIDRGRTASDAAATAASADPRSGAARPAARAPSRTADGP